MADEWKGEGDAPLKYFSLARERHGVIKTPPPPPPPAPVEDLPVTIPPLPEPPKKPEKSLEEMDYFDELIPLGKKLGIEKKLRKPQLLAAIKEIQASKGD